MPGVKLRAAFVKNCTRSRLPGPDIRVDICQEPVEEDALPYSFSLWHMVAWRLQLAIEVAKLSSIAYSCGAGRLTMSTDAVTLFTEYHGLYVRGVRVAVRERMEAEHGEDWWNKGVLANVSQDQREQLERLARTQSINSHEELLDVPHFGHLVCGSGLFTNYFADGAAAFRKFRDLIRIRNVWAHVRMENTSVARVVQSLETMEDILSSLRRREALDISTIRQSFSAGPSGLKSDEVELSKEDGLDALEELDTGFASYTHDSDPMLIWSQLHSYLVMDTTVEPVEDSPGRNRIRVNVTNQSPKGHDAPEVHFRDVSVVVHTSGRSRYQLVEGQTEHGTLAPGESFSLQIDMQSRQMAFTEFELISRVDWDRLFSLSRRETPPQDFVAPILDELLNSFEALGIKDFLDSVLNSIDSVRPDMTIQEAADLRVKLQGFQEAVAQKVQSIGDILREFMLDKNTRPGTHFQELAEFLHGLSAKIVTLDEAFGQTDLELINQAINELEQSQLAVMRLENAIKRVADRSR